MSQATVAPLSFTADEVSAAIKRLNTAGRSLSRAVQHVLVMAVFDSIVNESPATANALMATLRKSTKSAGIKAFLEEFGQLYDKGGKTGFVHFNLGAQASLAWTKDYVNTVQEAAEDWESFKPATEAKEIDVVKMVEGVIKKSTKDGAKVAHADLANLLQALLAQYTAAEALKKAKESAAASAEAPAALPAAEAAEIAASVEAAMPGYEVVGITVNA